MENKDEKKEIKEQEICLQCGTPLELNARFCGVCGWVIPLSIHSNNPSNKKNNHGENPDKNDYQKGKRIKKKKNLKVKDDHDNEDEDDERRYTVRIGPEGIDMRQSSEKDKEQTVRLNISVPRSKRKEWKTLAAELGESVSGLVRAAMGKLQNGLKNVESLEEFGEEMEEWGRKLEKKIKKSGIDKIGEEFERKANKNMEKPAYNKNQIEKIKKRIKGLILLQKVLPIEKLAHALDKSNEEAENLIYELVADGIEGNLEEGVFKFTSTSEEVISKLNELIDKM